MVYKTMKTLINMKSGSVLLALTIICMVFIPLVLAENIGTFKQYDCISLHQICSNCTFVNITSIKYPNGQVVNINSVMTKVGTDYNYTFCNSSDLGNYLYNTCGNKDGTFVCENLEYTITTTGDTQGNTLPIFLLILAFVLMGISIFTSNEYLAFFSGCVFVIVGVYMMVFGLGFVADMYTQTMAYVCIGIGILLIIIPVLEKVWDNPTVTSWVSGDEDND